ncbi:hypothetical protein Tco_0999537 [Tanacetum coccineum]
MCFSSGGNTQDDRQFVVYESTSKNTQHCGLQLSIFCLLLTPLLNVSEEVTPSHDRAHLNVAAEEVSSIICTANVINSQTIFSDPLRLNVSEEVALSHDRAHLNVAAEEVSSVNEEGCSSRQPEDLSRVGGTVLNVPKKRQRNIPSVESPSKRVRQTAPRVRNRRTTTVMRDDGEGCSSGQGRGRSYAYADLGDCLSTTYVVREGVQSVESPSNTLGAVVFDSGVTGITDFDVIIQEKAGPPKRINKLHKSYMSLQFPLLFVYGQAGFHTELKLRAANDSRNERRLTMLSYYAY